MSLVTHLRGVSGLILQHILLWCLNPSFGRYNHRFRSFLPPTGSQLCGCQGLHVHRHQYNVRPFPLVIWVPPKDPKMKFQFFTGRSSALRVNYQLLILKSNLLVVRSLRDLCRWALPGHCSQSAANDQGVEVHEPQLKALKVPQFSFWDPGKLAFFFVPFELLGNPTMWGIYYEYCWLFVVSLQKIRDNHERHAAERQTTLQNIPEELEPMMQRLLASVCIRDMSCLQQLRFTVSGYQWVCLK